MTQGVERQCREERETHIYIYIYKDKKNAGKAGKGDGFRKVKEVMPRHVQRCNFKAYDRCRKRKEW